MWNRHKWNGLLDREYQDPDELPAYSIPTETVSGYMFGAYVVILA